MVGMGQHWVHLAQALAVLRVDIYYVFPGKGHQTRAKDWGRGWKGNGVGTV